MVLLRCKSCKVAWSWFKSMQSIWQRSTITFDTAAQFFFVGWSPNASSLKSWILALVLLLITRDFYSYMNQFGSVLDSTVHWLYYHTTLKLKRKTMEYEAGILPFFHIAGGEGPKIMEREKQWLHGGRWWEKHDEEQTTFAETRLETGFALEFSIDTIVCKFMVLFHTTHGHLVKQWEKRLDRHT